jgi:hypothetical protein
MKGKTRINFGLRGCKVERKWLPSMIWSGIQVLRALAQGQTPYLIGFFIR